MTIRAAAPVRSRWAVLDWPRWSRLTVLIVFFAAVNWMLFAPASAFEDLGSYFPGQDKVFHGAIFLTLAWLARWSLPAVGFPGSAARRRWPAAAAGLALYAGCAEVLQPLIGGPGRQFEWLDLAANLSGVCAGWLLFGAAFAARPELPAAAILPPRGTPEGGR